MSELKVFIPEFGERTAPLVVSAWEGRLESAGVGVVRPSSRLSGQPGGPDLISKADGVFVPFSIDGSHQQVLLPETVDAIRYGYIVGKPIYSEIALTEQLEISKIPLRINLTQYQEFLSNVGEIVIGNDVELIKGVKV